MDCSILQSPTKRQRTVQKLVISSNDAKRYKDILEMIKEQRRDIGVIIYNDLSEIGDDWSDFTFFCGDFYSDLYKTLSNSQSDESTISHLIVGPAVLRHRLQTNQDMVSLRPLRPLYCEIMKNVTMKLGSEVKNKRELVEMVHFMGGSVRKERVPKTNVLISSKATRSVLPSTSVLDIPILKPDWIYECWNYRDNPYFNVFDSNLVEKHTCKVFEGLILYFHGFKNNETDDMLKNLKESGGVLTDDSNEATHIVYNSGSHEADYLPVLENQYHVTQEWYWVSLHRGSCAVEENFALPTMTLGRSHLNKDSVCSPALNSLMMSSRCYSKSASSMLDYSGEGPSLNATPDYVYSNDDVDKLCKSPKYPSKRLQVCLEMHETEKNYITLLKLLVKFKTELELEITQNEFIKKADVAIMFGKIEPIIEVHEKIFKKLDALSARAAALMVSKTPEVDDVSLSFSAAWIEVKSDLRRYYPPYLNSYDIAKKQFDMLDKENSKFHTFCKAKESNPDYHRLKLNDLMVKPVQRLPSVLLLLRELSKKADTSIQRSNADAAMDVIDAVLRIANKTRERNDTLITHMSKFTDIENVPPHLVAANRMFIKEIAVTPICSTHQKMCNYTRMKLFLFHDILLVTKIRSEKGTISRLARHASFVSLNSNARRPYKYIEQIQMSALRTAVQIHPPDNWTQSSDYDSNAKEPFVWRLIHRDEGGDIETVFESDSKEETGNFLDEIHIKIMASHGRPFFSNDYVTVNVLDQCNAENTIRFFRRQMSNQSNTGNNSMCEGQSRNNFYHDVNDSKRSGYVHQSKMRRAFSNAQISIATKFGFRRHDSRTNLGQISISENSSVMPSPRISCDSAAIANMTVMNPMPTRTESEATPSRSRARITQKTFLNLSLNRNTSLRRQKAQNDLLECKKQSKSQIS